MKGSLFVVILGWQRGLFVSFAFALSILFWGVSLGEEAATAQLPLSVTLRPASPESFEIAEGENAVLAVETKGGTGLISFTWYHRASGEEVWRKIYADESLWPFIADPTHFTVARRSLEAGANRCELTVHNFGAIDEGAYRCEVRDNLTRRDGLSSGPVSVRRSGPLAIRRQPAAAKAYVGGSTYLNLVVTGGSGPLHYEWMFDADGEGSGAAESVGPDLPRFTLDSVDETHAGIYTCTVRDSTPDASVVSTPAVLDVKPKITVAGPVITPGGDTHLTLYEKDGAVSFYVTASGGYPPYAYQWWRGSTRVEGATEATYTISEPIETNSGTYRCVVTDANGGRCESEDVGTLVVARPLSIVSQPQSSTGALGKPFTLTIVADGGYGTRHYQWKVDEDGPGPDTAYNIPGSADQPTYPILSLQLTDMAVYSCEVSDSFLQVEISDDAILLVEEEPKMPVFSLPPRIPTAMATQ